MRLAGLVVVALLALAAPAAADPALQPLGTFVSPTYATSPPGDSHRVFVTERPGRVRLILDGVVQPTPFLDVTDVTESGYVERGLLSIAFPPDYATSGRFYVYLTSKPAGTIEVREYRRSADPNVADPASGRIVLSIPHPGDANHNGGQLQFGPDGGLYAATGDGGGGDDTHHNAQNPASLLGKLVLIDAAPHAVASGLRNPWRFSFDRGTGELVIADVGQGQYEEIDVGLATNYGWPCFEGSHAYQTGYDECQGDIGATAPRIEIPHTGTGFCAIVGGYVVRDAGLPTLLGRYLFGDNCAAGLRSADLAAGTHEPLGLDVDGLSSFGEDACGRILVVSLDGPVSRLVDGAPTPCDLGPAPPPAIVPVTPTPSPGATTPPPPTARTPDRTPCRVSARVKGIAQRGRRGYVTVALRTNEQCRATLTARLGGKVARTRTVQLRSDHRTLVKLRLARHNHRRLTVRIRAVDGAGNVTTLTR
jgi:Glucose / Sorbosone dehydrogenase